MQWILLLDFSIETNLNASFVIIIPKWEGASSMKDYRTISLLRSIIISKMHVFRAKKVLDDIVSFLQNARGSQILDANFVANEVRDSRRKQ